MASKRTRANKPEMIHCPYCGEDYSSTYKHCPFCDEVEPAEDDYQTDEYDEAPRSRGGKRLVTNTRGGGYGGGTSPLKIIGTVVSLALIVAAVIIVNHHPAPGGQGRRGRPGGQHHAGGKRDPHPGRQPVGDRARR